MGYIYKITNNINQKIYIGKTSQSIDKRFRSHINNARNHINRYLYDAMNKYGYENFTIEEIEQCDDDKLDEREIFWINKLNSYFDHGFGYNMTAGGDGGYTWKHLSDNDKQKLTTQISNKNRGKKRTPQQKQYMSDRWKELGKEHFKHKTQLTKDQLHNRAMKTAEKLRIKVDLNALLHEIQYSGLTVEKIAQKFNISVPTLNTICKREFSKTVKQLREIKTKYKTGHKANIKDYNEYCRIHKQSALKGQQSPVYIKVDIDKVINLVKQGLTLEQISSQLKISRYVIRSRCQEILGYSFKELKKNVK